MVTRWDVTKAVRGSDLPPPSRLIMLTLADVAEVGTAEIPPRYTPSLTVLARETGHGRSTVKDHLTALEDGGWLERSRPDKAAQWNGERTRYRLLVPDDFVPYQVGQETAQGEPGDGPGVGQESAQGGPGAGRGWAESRPEVGRELAGGRPRAGHLRQISSDPLISSDLTYRREPSAPADATPKSTRRTGKKSNPPRPEVLALCERLADRIEANVERRPDVGKGWHEAARLLLDRDKRTVKQVEDAIDWCQADEFWRSNILSMPKLREKYDQLRLAAQRQKAPSRGRTPANRFHNDRTDDDPIAGAIRSSDYTGAAS